MKIRPLLLSVAALGCVAGVAQAASINLNFAENTNQTFAGGTNIGPLAVNSTNWNNTVVRDSGTLPAGTKTNLIDNTGTATTTDVTWTAGGVYYTNIGTANDQSKLGVGYLDDNGSGISITVSEIPYALYRIYGLFASDIGNNNASMQMLDFNVNSGTWVIGGAAADNTATVYGNINANATNNGGAAWTQIDPGTTVGNYWVVDGLTSPTLTINGQVGASGTRLRGSLAGLVIEEVPEPSAALLGAIGALALLRRRRN